MVVPDYLGQNGAFKPKKPLQSSELQLGGMDNGRGSPGQWGRRPWTHLLEGSQLLHLSDLETSHELQVNTPGKRNSKPLEWTASMWWRFRRKWTVAQASTLFVCSFYVSNVLKLLILMQFQSSSEMWVLSSYLLFGMQNWWYAQNNNTREMHRVLVSSGTATASQLSLNTDGKVIHFPPR